MYPWYVITGGPCSGKTSLIEELASRGYATVPEVARAYFKEQEAQGTSIEILRKNEVELQHALIQRALKVEMHVPKNTLTFFDRGIHDNGAYLALAGATSDAVYEDAVAKTHYKKAFILDLLPLVHDEVRTESKERVQEIHDALVRTYEKHGVPVLPVPVLPNKERADYVLARLT